MTFVEMENLFIKNIFIGPNPEDKKIFMIDYDNKGYRGGTDTFKCIVKLDKNIEDDIFESFKEVLYTFDYSDYPILIRREHNIISNDKYFYDLIKSSIDFIKGNSQIGEPTFIFINSYFFKKERIKKLIQKNIKDIIIYDDFDIIIGRKNTNPNMEPGLYLSSNNDKYSIDTIGHRAKNQYVILKINK